MRGLITCSAAFGVMLPTLVLIPMVSSSPGAESAANQVVSLPDPKLDGDVSVEEAIHRRRSERGYTAAALTLPELAQLLWAAQGLNHRMGYRTAPSAGALYPLELYVVAGKVDGLAAGVYRYQPVRHRLVQIAAGDPRSDLATAALGQSCVKNSPASIVFSAVFERTTKKYRERGIRYVHMEAGHAAQNVYLQAVSLNLGTVVIGAFYDDRVRKVVGLADNEEPLIIMPVGKRS
jgi:SagB-type dehydrogenase family enzyme